MRSRLRIALACLLAVALAAAGWRFSRTREPCHNGRALSQWLSEYRDAELGSRSEVIARDRLAIQQIGTNAIPVLLAMFRTHDSLPKRPFNRVTDFWSPRLTPRQSFEYHQMAALGFCALGSAGHTAVPNLIDLLHDPDPDVRHEATKALRGIGPAAAGALPALIQCTTNNSADIRLLADTIQAIDPDVARRVGLYDYNQRMAHFMATNGPPAPATP